MELIAEPMQRDKGPERMLTRGSEQATIYITNNHDTDHKVLGSSDASCTKFIFLGKTKFYLNQLKHRLMKKRQYSDHRIPI